jgi:hypothetical protein
MMPFVATSVLDAALTDIKTRTTRIVACSEYPASYAAVAGVTLGEKALTSGSFTGPAVISGAPGRRLLVSAFSDGDGLDSGLATYWTLVDDDADERLVVQAFDTPRQIVDEEPWSVASAIEIKLPGWPDEADA